MERTGDLAKVGTGLILILALVLRVAAARGDLALDEVWTLHLLQPLTNPWQIFWKINHDNNHYLNSLWLYAVGPDAPVLVQRGLSIGLSMLSVMAAGLWARRRGAIAALVTMGLLTLSYGMVEYGSEARGYAGLILCSIAALIFCEQMLAGKNRRWALALTCLAGTLFHFSMIVTAGVLAVWVALTNKRDLPKTISLLWPTILCLAPIVGWTGWLLYSHLFTIGMVSPFDGIVLLQAFSGIVKAATGLPGIVIMPSAYLSLLAAALALAFAWKDSLGPRFSLYLIAILLPPFAYYLFLIPNTNQPRYFLIGGIAYLLLVGELAGIAWQRSQTARIAAIAVLLIFAVGDGIFLYKLITNGRGHYRAAVATMATTGPARYGTNDAPRNTMLVDYYARQLNVTATYVPDSDWCAAPPYWYIAYSFRHDAPPPSITVGPTACTHAYGTPIVYPFWGLSGFQWALYRRTQ